MSSEAGLKSSAIQSRIKRRAVRPPVAAQARIGQEIVQDVRGDTPVASEPSEVKPLSSDTSIVNEKISPQVKQAPPKATKDREPKKKPGHTQPRFEARLSGDHEKIVGELIKRAFSETHPSNKGINNSELFGGFLEFIRPIAKRISFRAIDFKRGKLYGDGTEKIKVEVGRSLKKAALDSLLLAIETGDPLVLQALSDISDERRNALIMQIAASGGAEVEIQDSLEDDGLVVNG